MKLFSKIYSQKIGKDGAILSLDDDWIMRIRILENWLLRITLAPKEGLSINNTWMVCPKKLL